MNNTDDLEIGLFLNLLSVCMKFNSFPVSSFANEVWNNSLFLQGVTIHAPYRVYTQLS